jgi:hypothetical protein
MDVKPHKLNISDYRAIASLHCDHINQGFLATLGIPFLTLLYEAIDEDWDCAPSCRDRGKNKAGLKGSYVSLWCRPILGSHCYDLASKRGEDICC